MRIFRKRFFPNENIEMNDAIVYLDDKKLVTKWKAIRPKPDLSYGVSCFFIEEGIKISKFYREDGTLLYWYCDIGECILDKNRDMFTFVDLLADVIIYPNGRVRVVDLSESADVFESGDIGKSDICKMLRRLDYLLEVIDNGDFKLMQNELEMCE